jgi:hypothetical protein
LQGVGEPSLPARIPGDLVLFFRRRVVIFFGEPSERVNGFAEGENHGAKTFMPSLRRKHEEMEDPAVFHVEFRLSVGVLQ